MRGQGDLVGLARRWTQQTNERDFAVRWHHGAIAEVAASQRFERARERVARLAGSGA